MLRFGGWAFGAILGVVEEGQDVPIFWIVASERMVWAAFVMSSMVVVSFLVSHWGRSWWVAGPAVWEALVRYVVLVVMSRSSTRQRLAHLPTMEITPRYHVSVSRHISVLNMHNKSNELYMLRVHFQSPEAVNKFGLISGR